MNIFNRCFRILFRKIRVFVTKKTAELQSLEQFQSSFLGRAVRIDIYLPPGHNDQPAAAAYPFVIFNDGQDLEQMRLQDTLDTLWKMARIPHLIAFGVHAGDRMEEYGTAHQVDYLGRGSQASAYAQFITKELLPSLYQRFHLSHLPSDSAIAGFSLGGLSALDIAWQYPGIFTKIGVFSGSLWWRSKPFKAEDPDADRIAHGMVAMGPYRPGMKFWLQTGTNDETDDRNNNGIIDSIDDTLDLITELEKLGYQNGRDIRYLEVVNGEHNPKTWGEAMGDFLVWSFS